MWLINQQVKLTWSTKLQIVVNDVLKNLTQIVSLREEQVDCFENLVAGTDVFPILPTGFGNGVSTIANFVVNCHFRGKAFDRHKTLHQ